jgi:hypothetical protein
MFKELIKFTAKVGILAAVVIYIVLPNIPGMPKPGDLFHFPSLQEAVKFVIDPANLTGKGQQLQDWVHSKMPNISVAGHSLPKPTFTPPGGNLLDKDKTTEQKVKPFLDPGGLLPTHL